MHRLLHAVYIFLFLYPAKFYGQTVRITSYQRGVVGSQCNFPDQLTKARSKIECSVLCAKNPECKTFRYNRDDKVCHHSHGVPKQPTEFYFEPGAIKGVEKEGYAWNRGIYFKYYPDMMSHDAAACVCASDGGHLLTIPDIDVLNYLVTTCDVGDHPWIDGKGGLSYNNTVLQWAKWYADAPTNVGDCVGLCAGQAAMKVRECDTLEPFFCQIEL